MEVRVQPRGRRSVRGFTGLKRPVNVAKSRTAAICYRSWLMRWAAAVVALVAGVTVAHAAGSAPPPPFEDAITRAATQGKTLVVEIGTSWCGPCKRFEAKILPHPVVDDAREEVIFVRYDAEKGNGVEAAARLAVDSYPTFVVLDGKGRVRRRLAGVPWRDGETFARWLYDIASAGLDDDAIKARRAAGGHGPRVELIAANYYARERRFVDADRAYAAATRGAGSVGATAREARRALKVRWAAWKRWAAASKRALAGPRADVALVLLAATRLDARAVAAAAPRVTTMVAKDADRSYALALGLAAAGVPDLALAPARAAVAAGGGVEARLVEAAALHLTGHTPEARACLAKAKASASFLGHREIQAAEAVILSTSAEPPPQVLAERARLELLLDGPVDPARLR